MCCDNCKKDFLRQECSRRGKNKFCSTDCRYEFQKISLLGENNPNFGNKWDEELREKVSKIVSERMKDPEIRWKAGKANRGKKFSPELIEKCHGHRPRESYVHPKSEKTRKLIGIKSKEKFTPEFKEKQRKIFEEKGIWIPLKDKTDKQIYFKEAEWIDSMFNLVDEPIQLALLKEHRVFHATKNKYGVVRDHMYGRRNGFKNLVFPEILRHPCNCQIITRRSNVQKALKLDATDNTHSLEELFEKIKNYQKPWKEHALVLEKIKDYESGKRWERINK